MRFKKISYSNDAYDDFNDLLSIQLLSLLFCQFKFKSKFTQYHHMQQKFVEEVYAIEQLEAQKLYESYRKNQKKAGSLEPRRGSSEIKASYLRRIVSAENHLQ